MSRQLWEASAANAKRRGRRALAASVAGALAALLCLAGVASAKVVNLKVYNGTYPAGSFNASDAVGAGQFTFGVNRIDVDNSTGTVYVANTNGHIYKFDADGVSQPFSSVTPNTVISQSFGGCCSDLEVDNSGTATQGRIYAFPEFGPINAYDPSGAAVTGTSFPLSSGLGDVCGAAVGPDGHFWRSLFGQAVFEYDSNGNATGKSVTFPDSPQFCDFEIDSQGNFIVNDAYFGGSVHKYDANGGSSQLIDSGSSVTSAVDLSNDHIFVDDGNIVNEYDSSGAFIGSFGAPDPGRSYPGLGNSAGIAVNPTTHEVYVASSNNRVDTFVPTGPITIPDVTTGDADVNPSGALLHGTVNPDGVDTTDCHFEIGPNAGSYNTIVDCTQTVFSGTTDQEAVASVTGLNLGQTYHYRLAAKNASDVYSYGADKTFKPQGEPVISNEAVKGVNTDGATIHVDIDPDGGDTTYHIDWGTDSSYGNSTAESASFGPLGTQHFTYALAGLAPNTTYHFRVVATNSKGTTTGDDHEFTTFGTNPTVDPCPNAHVRQQTGSALLLDCRAYELVSAANAGGYDVESDIIPGQEPPNAFPRATDKVLYSLHAGTVPGIAGNPTNFGTDPYVATRGENGWKTEYVGLPANGMPSDNPFGSPLLGASDDLTTFAFGENGDGTPICDPCYADGSVNVPLRLADGSVVKGMVGTSNPPADPAGLVRQPVSADGSHFVFGTTAKLESDGNSNGDVTIYDRDLGSGQTHVVSKTPGGATMTGPGIAELDLAADGSRVLIGQLVSTDPTTGNQYWHLYMNVGDAGQTIDLTPGTTNGVLYAGMSADGTKVYFTTRDALGSGDTDASVDLYRADVGSASSALTRVSTGSGGGNADGCNPVSGWNNAAASANCDVVAFAGGMGVAAGDGSVYFLSPETLDGTGVADAPNLFVSRPGAGLELVATLEPGNPAIANGVWNNEQRIFGDFQVTPSGDFALFASSLPLTGFTNLGHSEIYRYDADAGGLACASCAPTGAAPETDAFLTPHGLNLADDGRVFFTSSEPLALRDTNGKADAYEWSDGAVQLISTGASEADSGILSVSADGVNAYFFTRQTLVQGDLNGNAVKIYDARAFGGFPYNPPPQPCKASDECHGPGTQAAPAPAINTVTGAGELPPPPQRLRCRRGFVKRHGRCVKRHRRRHGKHRKHGKHHRKHHRHTTRRHG